MAALSVFPLPLLIDAITKQVLNPSRVSTDSFPVFVVPVLVFPVFFVVPVFIFPVLIFPVLVFPVFIAVITLITLIAIIAVISVIAVVTVIAVIAIIFIVLGEMDTDEDDSMVVLNTIAIKLIGDLLRQNT